MRIIAAANRDLRALVASGNFREDLYTVSLSSPSVGARRNRAEDIPIFVRHFFDASKQRHRRPDDPTSASDSVLQCLPVARKCAAMENAIERMVVLSVGGSYGERPAGFLRTAAGVVLPFQTAWFYCGIESADS